MPTSVIVALAADAIGTYVAEAVIFDLVAATTMDWVVQYSLIKAATGFVASSLLSSAVSGSSDNGPTAESFAQQAQARTHILRSGIANRQLVYGEAANSGPLVFAATSGNNQTLYMIIPVAAHKVSGYKTIYLGDEIVGALDEDGWVTEGTFLNKARIVLHDGDPDQLADADFMTALPDLWTEDHRLRGIAYFAITLVWNRDTYPRGIPNFKAVMRGKPLYDPRTDTTIESMNWALACRDFIASPYGLACSPEEINEVSMIATANISDEDVTLAAGGTEKRYTCNCVLDTGATVKANIQAMLSGGLGTITWPKGMYTLHAASYDMPEVYLTENDLRGNVKVRPRPSRQELYNGVKGTFADPDQDYQPTDFPPITNATYVAQDGGETLWKEVAFPATTSKVTVQRLARIILEKSRQGITVEVPCKLTMFKVVAWSTIYQSLAHLGWANKVMRVTEWKISEQGGVDLLLQEESSSSYVWSSEERMDDPAPDTNLPSTSIVGTPGLPTITETLFETTGSAGVKVRVTATWASNGDSYEVDYVPEFRPQGGAWIVLPPTTSTTVEVQDLAPGIYEFRVRARNIVAQYSAYTATVTKELLGLTADPADVTGFYVTSFNAAATGFWNLSSDLDVRIGGRVYIRWTSLLSGVTWENGIDVRDFNGDSTTGPLPMFSGTYMAKFQDSTGHWSKNAAFFTHAMGSLVSLPNSMVITEHPTFAGTKTNTIAISGTLQLSGASLIDTAVGYVDTWGYIDTLGGVVAAGSYAFSSVMDFGSVQTRRITPRIVANATDTGDLVDMRGPVDDWDSVDGTAINDATATLYAATSQDGVSYGSWFPFLSGDITCWKIKFRLDLASAQPTHNIGVTELQLTANW